MIAAWICGFIVGILLGKSGIFFYPQNLFDILHLSVVLAPIVVFLIFYRRAGFERNLLIASFGAIWGSAHSAPQYIGPCVVHQDVRINPLQFDRGPAIVLVGGKIFEAKTTDKANSIGARNAGTALLDNRVIALNCASASGESIGNAFRQKVLDSYVERGGASQILGWTEAVVFGSQKNLPMRYATAFKRTGLIHLLVVSGLHVALVAGFLISILRFPFQIAYAWTLLTPRIWNTILILTEVVAAILIVLYVLLIGAPQAAQRAGMFFLVWILGKNIFGVRRSLDRFGACMVIQSILFPIGFLSSGNIMSWSVTLFLVARHSQSNERQSLFAALFDWRLQLKIMCLCGVVFSEVSLLSLPANLVLAPGFGMTLYLTIINLVVPHPHLSYFTSEFVGIFLEIIVKCSHFTWKYKWLHFGTESLPIWLRFVGLLTVGILILNSLRILSIRHRER